MLGGQPVRDRQHADVGLAREMARRGVVRVEIADHPPATVVVDDERAAHAVVERDVQPGGDRPGRSGEDAVLDARDRWRRGGEDARGAPDLRARLGGRHRIERAGGGERDQAEHELILRGELQPVDPHRPAASEETLHGRRERREEADEPTLSAFE